MKYLYPLILTSLLMFLNGCATNNIPNKTAQDLIADFKVSQKYLIFLNKFINYTKNEDIEKMLSMTGATFIKKHSLPEVRRIYKTVLIPTIQSCEIIKTGKNVTRATKEFTGVGAGSIYNKMCYKKDGKLSLINIAVLNDHNKTSISSVFIITANKPNK